MRTHIRLGRLFGVPIGLNWGVLAFCILLTLTLARVTLPVAAPDHPASAYWFAAVVGSILYLVSLTGHEVGHSYIAGRNDVRVVEITLWLFGGVAKLEREADNPGAEFRIAAAGPAMSMVMAGVFGAAFWLVQAADGSRVLEVLLFGLAAINAILAVSNLLPALPLDGGQMLRAVIWRRGRRRMAATRTAALWGQILSGVMIVASLILMWRLSILDGLFVMLFALFVLMAARSEWRRSAPQPELMACSVAALGRRLPEPLGRNSSVADLERVLAERPGTPLVPVYDEHGQISALVLPDAVMRVPPAQRHVVPIASLTEPIWSLPRVHPDESVEQVLDRLGRGNYWRAVVTAGGEVQGVLCSEDVDRVVELATA